MYVANAKRLTLAGAEKMCATAIEMAVKEGLAISVAIADSGGNTVLIKRMDGGRFHTVYSSTTKAVTAACAALAARGCGGCSGRRQL